MIDTECKYFYRWFYRTQLNLLVLNAKPSTSKNVSNNPTLHPSHYCRRIMWVYIALSQDFRVMVFVTHGGNLAFSLNISYRKILFNLAKHDPFFVEEPLTLDCLYVEYKAVFPSLLIGKTHKKIQR